MLTNEYQASPIINSSSLLSTITYTNINEDDDPVKYLKFIFNNNIYFN